MKILVMSYLFVMKWVFLIIDLNNINFDDTNHDDEDPDTIIHI